MWLLVVTFAILGVINFFYSLRLAYRNQRYRLAAGYPILGHALATFVMILCTLALVPRARIHSPVRGSLIAWLIGAAIFVIPIFHGWLLIKLDRIGEKRWLAA